MECIKPYNNYLRKYVNQSKPTIQDVFDHKTFLSQAQNQFKPPVNKHMSEDDSDFNIMGNTSFAF